MLNYTETVDILRNITSGILVGVINEDSDFNSVLKSIIDHPSKLSYDEKNVIKNLIEETDVDKLYFVNYVSSILKQLNVDDISPNEFNEKILSAMKTYDDKEALLNYYLFTKDLFADLLCEYENEIIDDYENEEYDFHNNDACGVNIEVGHCGISSKIQSDPCGANTFSRSSC